MNDDTELKNTPIDENEQILQRKHKLSQWRQQTEAYPSGFERDHLAEECHRQYDSSGKELEQQSIRVNMAGRLMTRRIMGKASFAHIQDMSGRIQLYISSDHVSKELYEQFKDYDLGDIIGVQGILFKTKTNELTVKVDQLQLLVKSLRPLPDKFHGLTDHEQRFRQRYLDLMVNEESRHVFLMRSQMVAAIRQFFNERNFVEVETPMMHTIPGGATARPFETHHNAMNMDLFLRVAPELYLKRLVVGGFEKVYEINRNFRNEGISTRHNPEFTMLEFYQAYSTYEDLMNVTEALIRYLGKQILNSTALTYQGVTLDLSRSFPRMSLRDSLLQFNPDLKSEQIDRLESAKKLAHQHDITIPSHYGLGRIQMELFEKLVEKKLQQPIFITEFPIEVSPLSRANDKNKSVADRFEFYAGTQEIANGFSELNDPEDQAARFHEQLKARESGDLEAMRFDSDYINALEYGLPPTAGEGIGIDRLVMLFTDRPSIRDVILFPLLRNAKK